MTTTTLIVEILISGILTCLWLLFGTLIAFGHHTFTSTVKDYPELAAVIGIAVAYTVGVTFDRLWDFLTTPTNRRIRSRYFPDEDELTAVRMRLFGIETALQGYMEYIRSRMRIARAAMCNLPLILLTGLGLALRHGAWSPGQYAAVAGLGLLAFAAATYSYHKLEHAYYRQLQAVGRFLASRPGP